MDEALVQGSALSTAGRFIGTNTGPVGAGHRVLIRGFELWAIGKGIADPQCKEGPCSVLEDMLKNTLVANTSFDSAALLFPTDFFSTTVVRRQC
jgi:hypothetical protein